MPLPLPDGSALGSAARVELKPRDLRGAWLAPLSELEGGGHAGEAVEEEGVVERHVLPRHRLDHLLRGDAAHHRGDRVHLAAAPPAELVDQVVAHAAPAHAQLLGHVLQAALEDGHVALHLAVPRAWPAAALGAEGARRAEQKVERAAARLVVERGQQPCGVDRVGVVLLAGGAEGEDLQPLRVLAEEFERLDGDEVRRQTLHRADLAQVRVHRRQVRLRLLLVDGLQRHVRRAVARHVRQAALHRQQPAALAVDEGGDCRGGEPEGDLRLAGGELSYRRVGAARRRRLLQLRGDLRDARSGGREDRRRRAGGFRQLQRGVDRSERLLNVLVRLHVGAAVALEDGAHLLLLLELRGQRAAIRGGPRLDRLDEQHDEGDVSVLRGAERRQVGVARGDELLQPRGRREDAQVGDGVFIVRLDDLVLGEGEAEVAQEAVRVDDQQRDAALLADGADLLELRGVGLRGDDDVEGVEEARPRLEDLRDVLVDEGARHVLVELLEQPGDARGPRRADRAALDEEVVACVRSAHHCAVDDSEGSDAWEHEVLQRLHARGGAVDQAERALLHRALPVLAPQPELPVVPLVLRFH
mmetsp:Transcript_11637/g.28766  ORF Transcript_11637/g.28766 Transcript_11637/m.28766 type:complete len:586 (-) Transcript_11637:82-1839(-)